MVTFTNLPEADFRDQLIAAPLKQGQQASGGTNIYTFPRSADRGPIEAMPARTKKRELLYFRDQLIAAPLKQPNLIVPLGELSFISAIS